MWEDIIRNPSWHKIKIWTSCLLLTASNIKQQLREKKIESVEDIVYYSYIFVIFYLYLLKIIKKIYRQWNENKQSNFVQEDKLNSMFFSLRWDINKRKMKGSFLKRDYNMSSYFYWTKYFRLLGSKNDLNQSSVSA